MHYDSLSLKPAAQAKEHYLNRRVSSLGLQASITLLVSALSFQAGCGGQPTAIDDKPFREAIGQYVQANNMAMKIKEMKGSPVVAGDSANLRASMTHEQLGGPAVTWHFDFAKQSDGSWRVVKHHD